MNSMKNIPQSFINQLEEYFHNDFDSLKMNILRGDIHLKNLKFKSRDIPLDSSPDFPFSLELVSGTIGSALLKIPWISPKTSTTSIELEDFQLILRLRLRERDPSRSYTDILHEQKMAKLHEEELRFTGRTPSNISTSLKDSIIQTIKSSIISSFVNGLTIQIINFSLSILFPLPNQDDLILLRISIPHISLLPRNSHNSENSTTNFIFDKEIIFQSFSVDFLSVKSSMTDEASYQTLVSTINTSRPALIINPFNMNLDISIYEEDNENSSLHFMTKSIWRSQLTVKISNFDMSPNLSQIALLRELSVYLKDSSRKFRSMIIRPRYNPSSTHSNISEWWKFALISTMIKRRGKSLLYPKNNFTIGFKSEISPSIRSKYIDIYIKYLENKRDNSGYVGLMEEEVKFLDEWSHLLDFGSLLIFRLSAHKRLEEKSIAAAAAQTTQKENALWQSLFTVFISPNSTETTPTSVPNTSNADVDFKILYRDVRQSLQELSYFNMYPVDIKIIFSRFALSVDQDDRRCRSLTIICYGLLWNYHQLCFSRDGMILLRLGSIRIFGKEGIQLVSCGDFTDEWFHNYDIQTSPTRLIALSYQHEWYTQNKRSVLYVLPSETVMKPSIAYNNSSKLSHGIKQHQIIEISCSTLRLFWDESSIRHISTMCSDIDTIWIWNFIFPEHSRDNSMKSAILRCSKIERKQLSLDSLPIVKFSVSGTLTGMIIQVPLASNSTRPSDRSQQQRPGRSPYLIEFHVGLCTVYSGDFLMSLDIFRTNNSSITGTSLSSDSIGNSTQFDETSLNYSEGIGNRFYSISSGIWSNRDKIMQNKVRKQIGGASLQHYICTIQNLELKGISSAPSSTTPTPTPSNQTSFTEFPINIQMLLTWCSDWSSLAPNLSIDLLSSAGHFSLEMMDLIRVIDAFEIISVSSIFDFLQSIWLHPSTNTATPPHASRLAALSPLCQLHFHYYLDSFRFTIRSNEQISAIDLRKDLITKYYETLTTRGSYSRITHTIERNLCQQLLFLGANLYSFEEFFGYLQDFTNPDSFNKAMGSLEIGSTFPLLVYRPILSVSLFNAQFSITHLAYDSRFNLFIDELIMFDIEFNPILHIFPKFMTSDPTGTSILPGTSSSNHHSHSHSHRKRSSSSVTQILSHNRRYSSLSILESNENISSLKKSSAINFIFLSRHEKYPWGKGGLFSTDLLSSSSSGTSMTTSQRIMEINLEIDNIDTLMTSTTFSTIFDSFLPLMEMFAKRPTGTSIGTGTGTGTGRDASGTGTTRSFLENNYEITMKGNCIHSVIMMEKRTYHSEIILTNILLEIPAAIVSDQFVNGSSSSSPPSSSSPSSTTCLILEIFSIELYNLSLSGDIHSPILSRIQSPHPMVILRLEMSTILEAIFKFTGVRLCLLSRYFIEIYELFLNPFLLLFKLKFDQYKSLFKSYPWVSTKTLHHPLILYYLTLMNSSPKTIPKKSFLLRADFDNFTCILPRNSSSNDLIGITIDDIQYQRRYVTQSWSILPKMVIENKRECLYFDPMSNSWKWSNLFPQDTQSFPPESKNEPQETFTETVFIPQPTTQPVEEKNQMDIPDTSSSSTVSQQPFKRSIISRLFADLQPISSEEDDDDDGDIDHETVVTSSINLDRLDEGLGSIERSTPRALRSSIKRVSINLCDLESDTDSDDDHEFFDTNLLENYENEEIHTSRQDPPKRSSLHTSTLYKIQDNNLIIRHQFYIKNMNIYSSMNSAAADHDGDDKDEYIYRRFLPISSDSPVYTEYIDQKTSKLSLQRWHLMTMRSFDTILISDILGNTQRYLITDDEIPSKIHLNISLLEYYLLLSLYYDNLFEIPQFSHRRSESQSTDNQSRPTSMYPSYGTMDYFEYIRNLTYELDIHIVRGEIILDLMMNINLSIDDISSLQYLSHDPESDSEDSNTDTSDTTVPFCTIQMKWISLHCQIGTVSHRTAFGIGDFLLTDMRSVDRSHGCHTIRLSQDTSNTSTSNKTTSTTTPLYHGYCDFNYGTQSISSLLSSSSSSSSSEVSILPIQGTAFEIFHGWLTIFLGSRSLDMDIRNFELFYLLQDYFSLYYIKSIYGNPALEAISLIDPLLWPITGIDLNLFLVTPHIQIAEYSYPSSNSVVIEVEDGLSIRLIRDRYNSYDIQIRMQNLAIIFLKSYQNSTATIGVRGAAGSGLGIRTILADTNIRFSYHYDSLHKQSDFQFILVPKSIIFPQNENYFTSNIDLYQGGLLVLPKDYHDHFTEFNENFQWNREYWLYSSQIVLSYDDFISLYQIFYSCLMLQTCTISDLFTGQHIFLSLQIHCLQFLIVDNILGLHLPLIQMYIPKIHLQFDLTLPRSEETQQSLYLKSLFEIYTWLDTFNNTLKCWEPFLDPFSLVFYVEKSDERGNGVTIKFGREIHANISIPVLRTLDDLLKIYITHRNKEHSSMIVTHSTTLGRKSNYVPDIHEVTQNNRKSGSQYTSQVILKRSTSSSLEPNTFTKRDSLIPSTSNNSLITPKEKSVNFHFDEGLQSSILIDHVLTMPLSSDARVGFSILNLTGYPIRYLQYWENGSIRTLQYLESGQRGLLNFIASKTLMRDGDIIEVQFNTTHSGHTGTSTGTGTSSGTSPTSMNNKYNKKSVGHYVSLQIAGYKWLRRIQADTLGIKFEDIQPVLGLMDLRKAYPNNIEVQQTIKLVTEVRQENGGRVLQLNSVFIIKNSTLHPLQLLTNETSNINIAQEDNPFIINSGESFYVPLALLYRSIVKSKADSLGYIWLKPLNAQPVVEELGIPSHLIGDISYTVDPINLKQTVKTTMQATLSNHLSTLHHLAGQQLSCKLGGSASHKQQPRSAKFANSSTRHLFNKRDDRYHHPHENFSPDNKDEEKIEINRRSGHLPSTRIFNYDMLPAFCYNIEIESLSNSNATTATTTSATINTTLPSGNLSDTMSDTDASGSKGASDKQHKNLNVSPRIYSIVIHPPIVLENLLPVSGTFELVQAKDSTKTVLWSAVIEPGQSKSVHTVAMDNPLLLLINLDFCRSSEGVLIHTPLNNDQSSSLADTVYKTLEEGLRGLIDDEIEASKSRSHIILTDTVGQRLRLDIQNNMGGGGHRNILIYCPYWVINTSQYAIRLKEEGSQYLPAGTFSPQRDGRIPLISMKSHQGRTTYSQNISPSSTQHHEDFLEIDEKVFPGSPGPLHSSKVREIEIDSPLQNLLSDLSFDQIMSMASMFNFLDGNDTSTKLLGSQKVIAQLDDSNWSKSFTLESVGVNQVLSVDHSERGMLELSFKISSAPGKLGVYTKIIRFSPRFVVVNKLPLLAEIIQVNGFSQEKIPIQISSKHLKPFHLPAVFGERQIAIDIAGPWIRSVSFDIDHLGSHTLRIKKYIDPSSLEHIMTRGTPEYDVILPPGEIGIWFETDWDHDQIVVMKIKKGSIAATKTDIQEGDVLLRINNIPIINQSFEMVMEKIKLLQQTTGTILTLQTIEEKMRLIRINAMLGQSNLNRSMTLSSTEQQGLHISRNLTTNTSTTPSSLHLNSTTNGRNSLLVDHEMELMNSPHTSKDHDTTSTSTSIHQETIIHVQMKSVDSSIFMILTEPDKNARPEYQIINKSGGYSIQYRQKGMYGARWSILNSGDIVDYIFDDPTKIRSINLRIVSNILCPLSYKLLNLPIINEHPLSCISMNSTEILVTSVLFDEIGLKTLLNIPYLEKKLEISIISNGPTKLLIIDSPYHEYELQYAMRFIQEQILLIESLLSDLYNLKNIEDISLIPSNCIINLLDGYVRQIKERQDFCVNTTIIPQEEDNEEDDEEEKEKEEKEDKDDENRKDINRKISKEQFLNGIVPFTSVFGPIITKQNQILVEVLQATGLPPAPLGGTDETYCEVSLRCANIGFGRKEQQRQVTYINDQTSNPYWIDQIFLFDVPVDPSQSIRGYNISLRVKSKSLVGRDTFIGEADIPLTTLVTENELYGWFALKPKKYSQKTVTESSIVCGSLQVRIQWIHSLKGLIESVEKQGVKRLQLLKDYAITHQKFLKVPETSRRSEIHNLAGEENTRDSTSNSERSSLSRRKSRRRTMENLGGILSRPNFPATTSTMMMDIMSSTSIHSDSCYTHQKYLTNLLYKRKLYPKYSDFMNRKVKVIEFNHQFNQRMELEFQKNFNIVNATVGYLEIFPEIALNLPITKGPLSVHLSYNNEIIRTHHSFGGETSPSTSTSMYSGFKSIYQWNNLPPIHRNDKKNYFHFKTNQKYHEISGNTTSIPSFQVDTLNIRGDITLRIIEERFPSHIEIASIDIPIFHLLSFLDNMQVDGYTRWFRLNSSNTTSTSMMMDYSDDTTSTLLSSLTPDKNFPCICLSLKWIFPKKYSIMKTKFYSRLQIPSISMSLIDSLKVREILHMIIRGIEGRYSESQQLTNQSLHITWLQINNQLYHTSSSSNTSIYSNSILIPTCIIHPQPLLRLYICKNNQLSVETTSAYDKMEFILQEIDCILEQQIIASIWEIEQIIRKEKMLFYRKFHNNNNNGINHQSHGNSHNNSSPEITSHQPFTSLHPTSTSGVHTSGGNMMNDTQNLYSQINIEEKLYVEHFYISPIVINISFLTSPKSSYSQTIATEVLSERSTIDSSNNNSPIQIFLWQVGEVVLDLTSNITNSSLKFNGLSIDYMFKTWFDITTTLREHYLNSALGQIYRIVGSLDLVNNSVGLLSSLGTGVRDFFYEPAYALISHPTELKKIGEGVMKGAVSLASNTADGIIGTTTVMTRSVGRGIAYFAHDDIFLANRERLNQYPDNACGIISRPFRDIGNGIFCGVVGIVRLPYQDYRKFGISGLLTGLGKGLAGLGAKPVIGVLDAVTHTGEGIRSIVKSIHKTKDITLQRSRYPSIFGIDGRLLPYQGSCALGAYLLNLIEKNEQDSLIQKFQNLSDFRKDTSKSNTSTSTILQRHGNTTSASTSTSTGMNINTNWPLIRSKRRRSIVDPTSESLSLEGIVYTTKLIQLTTPKLPLFIIITTRRVILLSYESIYKISSIHILWQCSIKDLDKPILHYTDHSIILTLINQRIEGPTSSTSGGTSTNTSTSGNSYLIETEINFKNSILQLLIVLNIILYQYDPTILPIDIHPSTATSSSSPLPSGPGPGTGPGGTGTSTLPYTENNEILSIGPWQYSQYRYQIYSIQDVNDIENLIVNNLENSSWKIDTTGSSSSSGGGVGGDYVTNLPKWLQQDKKFVIDAHESIQTLLQMCANSSSENSAIIKSLMDGCMSSEEFRIFIEKDLRFGSAIHETDEFSNNWLQLHSHTSGNTSTSQYNSNLHGTNDSNFGKTINKIGKRLRNSVIGLPLPFFKQKSDSQISELSSTIISQTPNIEILVSQQQYSIHESPNGMVMDSFQTNESKENEGNICDSSEIFSFLEVNSNENKELISSPSLIPESAETIIEENTLSPPMRTYHPSFISQPMEPEMKINSTLQTNSTNIIIPPDPPLSSKKSHLSASVPASSLPELLEKIERVEKLMSLLTSTPEGAAILAEIAQSNQDILPQTSKSIEAIKKMT